MELASKFEPQSIEDKWYQYWMDHHFFESKPDHRPSYTIVIPPPNVTGILHMGHMLNNTIQDILIRRARMQGYNACWVPGTDHASIATEAKVVAMLKEKGIHKDQLTREEFLKYAWEWKEKHGGIILKQLKVLGASCDWSRTKFTMDESMSESVIDVFVDLYEKGLIYRGVRMVNWDTSALTAVSDEEVVYKELSSHLYYVRYQIEGEDNYLTIATTRPETILGDTAVCMHPEDDRYKHLKGKRVLVPLLNRSIPLIFDEYVDRDFGTGALKITPAHDINDYNLGLKYHLETIDIFNPNGTLNEKARLLVGMDRFKARTAIVQLLKESGNLVKIEDYTNKVGFSERTDAVIEPKLSMQWFCNMKKIAEPALEVVMNDTIKFYPEKFKNTYSYWMENIKDWCISRQLWWGHRIPVYYLPNGQYVVAKTLEEAYQKALKIDSTIQITNLKQDEDVLDTWFSSWLWPISVFDGIRYPDNSDIKYYYPSKVLITAPEILFFWVARMIMAGLEWRQTIPFENVYLTGIVRDSLKRKMSKSLGNSPDPIALIKKYGADGVRVGMLLSSPAGNDLLFDEALCEQGRNFSNKIWNALRLIKGWQASDNVEQFNYEVIAINWFEAKLQSSMEHIQHDFDKYRISDALMNCYKLIWDDFCSDYLEIIKPKYQQPINFQTYQSTINIFGRLMQLLHPFMPFITEEIWHIIKERQENESITVSQLEKCEPYKQCILDVFEFNKNIVESIRRVRAEKQIAFKVPIKLTVKLNQTKQENILIDVLKKLCHIEDISFTTDKISGAISFMESGSEFFIPIGQEINIEEEIKKLKADLDYTEKFKMSVEKKLSNAKFVDNAPQAIVDMERKKLNDAEDKIRLIIEQIKLLKQ